MAKSLKFTYWGVYRSGEHMVLQKIPKSVKFVLGVYRSGEHLSAPRDSNLVTSVLGVYRSGEHRSHPAMTAVAFPCIGGI